MRVVVLGVGGLESSINGLFLSGRGSRSFLSSSSSSSSSGNGISPSLVRADQSVQSNTYCTCHANSNVTGYEGLFTTIRECFRDRAFVTSDRGAFIITPH